MTFTAHRAQLLDIDDIVAAATDFFYESDNHPLLDIDTDSYRRIVTENIDNPYAASFIVREGGRLAGYIHVYCQTDFTRQAIGELYQFYVRPEFRATGVARALLAAASAQWDLWECKRIYAEVSSGIDQTGRNNRLFVNLWRKFGFIETGVTMKKECL